MKLVKLVYLNGKFIDPESAMVSAFDRGFIFGDSIYEVIPVYGRRAFRLSHHLDRLKRNLGFVSIQSPVVDTAWADIFDNLIINTDSDDQYIYLQITRGIAPRDHAFPVDSKPTVFAYSQPLIPPEKSLLDEGVKAITTEDIRWRRCDIKTTALLANVILRQTAVDKDAVEAILIRDGHITEGAVSNVILVEHGTISTPPKNELILPGITRDLVLELAQANDIPVEETNIDSARLARADEVWLTSSTKEILPVTAINDTTVGSGKPGPLFATMYQHYQDYKQAFREGKAD